MDWETANLLGYLRWSELLPDDNQTYQFTSHYTFCNEAVAGPRNPKK